MVFLKICRVVLKYVNYVSPGLYKKKYPGLLRKMGVKIPEDYYRNCVGYIDPTVYFDSTDYSLISIGKNTTISKDVIILTHDFSIVKGLKKYYGDDSKANGVFIQPVSVGENCFIGARSIILPGTVIGDNVIIAAGAIVKGEIKENTVAGGNPAKPICSIDSFVEKHLQKGDIKYIDYEKK